MADVLVNVQQNVTGSSDVQKAAAGMAKLAAQEERLDKLAAADRALGVGRDPKKLAAALKVGDQLAKAEEAAAAKKLKASELIEKKQSAAAAKALKDHQKRVKDLERAEKDRARKLDANQKKAITDSKKFAESLGKAKSGNLIGLGAEFGSVGIAAGVTAAAVIAVAAATTVAAIGVGALVTKITLAALEARKARDESQGLVSVYANGDPVVLKLLSRQLEDLGVSARDGEAQFVKLRKAGASIGEAAQAITLIADIDARRGPLAAAQALEEITDQLGQMKSKVEAIKDPKLRAAEQAKQVELLNQRLGQLGKQADAAGNGADALAKKNGTLAGALFKLENIKLKTLEKIGDAVGPSVDKLSQKVANMVTQFLGSEKGQAAITSFGNGVSKVIDGIGKGIDFVATHWDKIAAGAKLLGTGIAIAMAPAALIIGGLGVAAVALGAAWAASTAAVGAAVAVIGKLAGFVGTTVGTAIGYLKNAIPLFLQAGSDLVQGVINGVSGAAGRLFSAVGNIASGALGRFKSVLGIASPSKLFAVQGGFIGAGAAKGIEASAPKVEGAAEKLAAVSVQPMVNARSLGSDSAPAQVKPLFSPAPAQQGPSSGGDLPPMHFHFYGVPMDQADDFARSVRREVEAMLSGMGYMGGSRS